jgi:DNA-binding CsgD family transcriptional regulator
VASFEGDGRRGKALLEESLAVWRTLGNRHGVARNLRNLGRAALAERDLPRARRLLGQALETARECGLERLTGYVLEGFAGVASLGGDAERALRLAGATEARRARDGERAYAGERDEFDAWLAPALAALGNAGAEAARMAGAGLSVDAAVAEALAARIGMAAGATLPRRETAVGRLTAREREVASLVARGLTNRQIAASLAVAARTADAHVEHIRDKLGVRSRAQIAAWAVERGLASS